MCADALPLPVRQLLINELTRPLRRHSFSVCWGVQPECQNNCTPLIVLVIYHIYWAMGNLLDMRMTESGRLA